MAYINKGETVKFNGRPCVAETNDYVTVRRGKAMIVVDLMTPDGRQNKVWLGQVQKS